MKYFTACLLLLLAFAVYGEEAKVPHVTIQTSFGPIEIELNPVKAPESVETFLTYVKEGFYEGTIFHRVINNFVVQGGGYTVDFKKKDTHPSIPNEAANGLKNLRSTVALARSNDPHSANSQFFVNVRDNKFLDYKSSTTAGWGYCVFGKVVEGMEVVDKIAKTSTDSGGPFKRDVPQTPITIDAVKVEYVAPTDWVISAGGPDKPAMEKKPTSEDKKKSEPAMADMQQDMLSMDIEEDGKSPAEKNKSGAASTSKPAGDKSPQEAKPAAKATDQADDQAEADDQAADTKVGKVATPVDAKIKVHHEAKTDNKPVPEKQEKPKAAVADDTQEEDRYSRDTEESEPATASDKKKMPAGTDQKSAEAKTGKEAKAHDEAKVAHKPVPEKQAKPKAAAVDDMSEEEDSEPATVSDKKKIPAGTDKKSSEAKTGKEAKVTIEKDTSEQTALEEDPAKDVVKTEHSAKTTPNESSKKMVKEDSSAKSMQEKDTPAATTQSSQNQPSTKAELAKKAVASIEERTAEKTMVKPGEKAFVGKSSGKTTPPPDSPTPPDKPEPVAY
jgi:cyclophilin family peptidyl-prolyl cis-trans isomerase